MPEELKTAVLISKGELRPVPQIVKNLATVSENILHVCQSC